MYCQVPHNRRKRMAQTSTQPCSVYSKKIWLAVHGTVVVHASICQYTTQCHVYVGHNIALHCSKYTTTANIIH